MARPANADAAATRQRILDSALSMFATRGVGQSSVREIAKGAGVSLGMVHHYFGSKDGLYEACEEATYAELADLRAQLQPIVMQAATDPHAALERVVREGYRFARAHGDAVRFAMRHVVETRRLADRRRDEVLLPFLDMASRAMAQLTGEDPGTLRLRLQSLVLLVGRYAISDDMERRAVTGMLDLERAGDAIEDHLVDVARGFFPLPRA